MALATKNQYGHLRPPSTAIVDDSEPTICGGIQPALEFDMGLRTWLGLKRARIIDVTAGKPWFSESASAWLDGFLSARPESSVLECGAGSSTVFFARRAARVVSFEHNPVWFDRVRTALCAQDLSVDLRLCALPYFPRLDDLAPNQFDLIVIDGRNRLECAKRAVRLLRRNGYLVFDDSERKRYAELDDILCGWARMDFPRTKGPKITSILTNQPTRSSDRGLVL